MTREWNVRRDFVDAFRDFPLLCQTMHEFMFVVSLDVLHEQLLSVQILELSVGLGVPAVRDVQAKCSPIPLDRSSSIVTWTFCGLSPQQAKDDLG